MPRTKRLILWVLVFCLLAVVGVQAMSSANYRLDWMVPLTGGGGPATATGYTAHVTIGQTMIGAGDSAGYHGEWGYWVGGAGETAVYLPIVIR